MADLTRAEIAEGANILRDKLMKYKPKIAVFNGKAIYEVYSGQVCVIGGCSRVGLGLDDLFSDVSIEKIHVWPPTGTHGLQ